MSKRLLVADAQPLVRQSLRALLERDGYEVVAEAGDGREAVRLAREHRPDLALLDLEMPVLNGLDAARRIVRSVPSPKVVFVTEHSDERYVTEALQAGARGYVLKSQQASDLLRALEEVAGGAVYLSPQVSHVLVEVSLGRREIGNDPLTDREREVLQLVAEGSTTREVAETLGVSVKTAESHRSRMMRKLDIHHVAGLVRYAIRRGMLQP